MKELREYVINHTERGACKCGQCFDAPSHPEKHQPDGHTVDLVFFKVAAKGNPDKDTLIKLIRENKRGDFCDVDVLDGKEHNYLELGGWIGSQGLAMMLMGLGSILGIWILLSPRLFHGISEDMQIRMAQRGLLSIQVPASVAPDGK